MIPATIRTTPRILIAFISQPPEKAHFRHALGSKGTGKAPAPSPMLPAKATTDASNRPSTAENPDQNDHNGHHEQQVDEPAHGVGRDQSEYPEDKQDHGNCLEHVLPPFVRNAPDMLERAHLAGD